MRPDGRRAHGEGLEVWAMPLTGTGILALNVDDWEELSAALLSHRSRLRAESPPRPLPDGLARVIRVADAMIADLRNQQADTKGHEGTGAPSIVDGTAEQVFAEDVPAFVTHSEAARRLGVDSTKTITRMCAAGELPCVRRGARYRVLRSGLDAYVGRSQ